MHFKLFLIALPVFFAIDLLWLGVIARSFYRDQLGSLMLEKVNWLPAILFYLIFIVGLVVLIIEPAMDRGSWTQALWRGAVFGFVAYATYDLTNLATLRDWPVLMTAVDLVWGTVLAGSVSVITYSIADRIGV